MKTKEKDHRNMPLTEVIDWVNKNCTMDDVRKRLKSRSVAYILACHLKEAVKYISELEERIKELEGEKND